MEFLGPMGNVKWPLRSKVWKYMNIAKFLYLLKSHKLYFSKVTKFDDPFEGVVGEATRRYRKSGQTEEMQNSIKYLFDKYEKEAKNSFVNCWHVNDYENLAMWQIYADLESGIAIQSDFRSLIKAIKEKNIEYKETLYRDKVQYVDFEKEKTVIFKPVMPLFYKRKSFEHEKELRIVRLNTLPADNGWCIDVNLISLIKKVYVAPKAPDYYKEAVEELINKYDLGNIQVIRSDNLVKRPEN